MTKKSYIDKHKTTIQKFTDAVYKAQTWVQTHSAEEIADAVQPYFTDIDRDIVVRVVDRYKQQGSFATDPIVDGDEWNNLLNIMTQAGELKTKTDHDTLVDNEFAEQAMK